MIWGGDAQHPFLCHISSQHLGHMGVPVFLSPPLLLCRSVALLTM